MCGFTLKPCNFFVTNPALDVPPPDRKENKSIYANAKNGMCNGNGNGNGCHSEE
jgi:primary-amine oxidase